jgi:hypothetical protein
MSDSPLLGLPFVAASQAQKHVTVNDALSLLDGLLHLSVISRALATAPPTAGDGDRYLLATGATGAWAGHAGHIAFRVAGAWRFLVPRSGWRIWIEAENILLVFNGTAWVAPPAPSTLQNLSLLGVNATADATNKIAVSSSAVLFNNAGAGVQFKINKNAPTDTASLLFQTGFSGRAEIGSTGDDDLHFKVSANGSSYNESLIVAAASGKVTIKNTLAIDPQSADPSTPSNGQLWYNSTSGKFRGQQNGASIDLVGAGGGGVADGAKGDITVSGAGTVWSVANNTISNAKLAQMPSGTFKANNAGAAGAAIDLTTTQAKNLLAIAATDVAGLGPLATAASLNLAAQATGAYFENIKGSQALELFAPALLGRKSFVLDFVGGGYGSIDPSGGHDLRSIESISGITLSTPANAIYTTRKKKVALSAANTFRYQYLADGTPTGILLEPSFSYLNAYSQPTVANLASSLAVTDVAAPADYAGNWIGFGDNTTTRLRGVTPALNLVNGSTYHWQFEIQMADGSLPVIDSAGTAGDLTLYTDGVITFKKPSDGTNGFDIEGPFAGNVYIVKTFGVSTYSGLSTGGSIQKKTTQSAKAFKIGRVNTGAGRYPPSLFDNATATPNWRAGDVVQIPLSGITSDEITLAGEFIAPTDVTSAPYIFYVPLGGTDRLELYISSSRSLTALLFQSAVIKSSITLGTVVASAKYRFAISLSRANLTLMGKVTGLATTAAASLPFATVAPSALHIGNNQGNYQLGSGISVMAMIDRAWTASEIASWTDALQFQYGTFSGSASGTNTGDQTIVLSGDVIGSGTAGLTTILATNAVTNAKLAQMPALSFKGNGAATVGNAVDLTADQVLVGLNIHGLLQARTLILA